MAGGINPSVNATDTFASHMRQINQRLASLERAASAVAGGGGGGGETTIQFWNSAWGVLSHVPSPATVVTVAATSTPVATSAPVTLYAGRRYRVRGGIRAWQTTPATANADLTLVVSGPFAPGSNSHDQYATTGGGYSQGEWLGVFDCTADTPGAVYALTATTTAAATLFGGGNAGVTVEDVGPITQIAIDPPPATDWSSYDARFVNVTGDMMTGSLDFQAVPLSQRINLYNTSFGIGIQGSTLYNRASANHAWFKGGVHSDATLDPGAGGVLQMHLDTTSRLFVHGSDIILGDDPSTGRRLRMHYPGSGEITYIDFEGATAGSGSLYFRSSGSNTLVLDPTVIRPQKPVYGDFQFRMGGGVQTLIVDNGNGPYYGMYGGADPDNLGSRKGYMGFSSATGLYINNEVASGHIYINSGSSGIIAFMPGTVEQARFDSTGILLINKTASSGTTLGFEIQQTGTIQGTRLDSGTPYVCNKQVGATSGSPMFSWRVDNTQVGSVSRNAATSAVLYNTTSQIDLKGAIERLDGERAIALIRQWEPIRFQFRFDSKGRMTRRGKPGRDFLHGFDAQKMHKLAPYAVAPGVGTEDEHYAWQERDRARLKLTMAWNKKQDAYEKATREHSVKMALLPKEEQTKLDMEPPDPLPQFPVDEDPFRPWGMDHSMLVPDLVAAVQGLVQRVEDQADELRTLRKLLDKR